MNVVAWWTPCVLLAACVSLCASQLYKPPTDTDKVRERFLKNVAKSPSFAWYNKLAVDVQARRVQQQKKNLLTPESVLRKVKTLEANAQTSDGAPTIPLVNKPLADFLYQGDLLLTEVEAVHLNLTQGTEVQRKAGGTLKLQGGGKGPEIPKWPHDAPICYNFDPSISDYMKGVSRDAFKYWTDNTCLTWQEGCATKPPIKIFNGDGCYTTKGRQAKGFQGTEPIFADEMPMSLQEPGCEFFATVAHEASHAMGMAHEQSRPDRDDFIDVVWSNIAEDWKAQYDKADDSNTFKLTYDYGSNMQYTGYANDPKIDMAAKDKIFQHTMGNEYGPIFNDIKIINEYNDCMCKSGATCQNQGFPHPRDCNKCICPEGFSGTTCTDRTPGEFGAPAGCGATLDATATWQTVKVDVPAPTQEGPPSWPAQAKIAKRQACCTWWIKAPAGKKVEIKLDDVTPGSQNECVNDCKYGGTEIKYGDLTRGGFRVCCKDHQKEAPGPFTSASELVIIHVCSGRNTQAATLQYRTSDTPGDCKDEAANCPLNAALCDSGRYATVMKRRCHKTCKVCT